MPQDGALHGPAVDHLLWLNLFWLSLCFIAAHLLLAWALLRRSRRTKAHSLPNIWLVEILPTLVLCGLFGWMAVAAQRLWAANRFEGASLTAMQVEVVGVQFQWYFRYPGADATFGQTRPELVDAAEGNPLGLYPKDAHAMDDLVSSVLVLPAGREVDLRLRSQDVIHGFFIPGMRLKESAVPGLLLHVHFTPRQPGDYPILCTQVCGSGHARMQATLRVLPPSQFASWLAQREQKQSVRPRQ